MKIDKYGFCHLNVVVTEKADEAIRTRAKEKNMTVTDFIIDQAISVRIPDSDKLKKIQAEYSADYEEKAKAFLKEIKEREGDGMNRPNGASKKTAQFHLRVSPEAFQIIQDRAEAMSMSVSDYVTFITTRFDIEEINKKLDKLIALLEKKECEQA